MPQEFPATKKQKVEKDNIFSRDELPKIKIEGQVYGLKSYSDFNKFLNEYIALYVLRKISDNFKLNVIYPEVQILSNNNENPSLAIKDFENFTAIPRFALHTKSTAKLDASQIELYKLALMQARVLSIIFLNADDHRCNYSFAENGCFAIDFDEANDTEKFLNKSIEKIFESISKQQGLGNVFCGSELSLDIAKIEFLYKDELSEVIKMSFEEAMESLKLNHAAIQSDVEQFKQNCLLMLENLKQAKGQSFSLDRQDLLDVKDKKELNNFIRPTIGQKRLSAMVLNFEDDSKYGIDAYASQSQSHSSGESSPVSTSPPQPNTVSFFAGSQNNTPPPPKGMPLPAFDF